MRVKKKASVVIWCFVVAATVVLGGFVIKANVALAGCKGTVKSTYRQACADLAESLMNVDYSLQKCRYAATPVQAVTMATEVWREAGRAKFCLETLPVYELGLVNTSKFFSQVGEYTLSLAKKSVAGDEITPEEQQTLEELSDTAREMASAVIQLQYTVADENLCCDDLVRYFNSDTVDETDVRTSADGSGGYMGTNPFLAIENSIDLGPLNYDGRFSDHLYGRESSFLEGREEITQTEARKRAAYVLGCRLAELDDGSEGTASGFGVWLFNGKDKSVSITKNGGFVCEFGKYRAVADANVTDSDAEAAAKDFLDKLELKNMVVASSNYTGNILTMTFCYCENDVVCYPDSVTVSVAMDNGEITAMSAYGYLMNHSRDRDMTPVLTKADALEKISSVLTAKDAELVMIDLGSYSEPEKLCWEILAETEKGQSVAVYINARNGREEDIKIIYTADGGRSYK